MAAKYSSIKQKVALSFIRIAGLLVAMIFIIIALILFPKIWQLELHNIKQDLLRTINTLEHEVSNLGAHADDWAYWDDTYRYFYDRNPEFSKSNLNNESLRDARLDFINLLTPDGKIIWGRYLKEGSSYAGAPTSSGLWPERFISELRNQPQGISGYFSSQFGVFCFAARPVLTTNRQGPSQGWFITGRWLNDSFTTRVNRQMQQVMTFQPQKLEGIEVFDRYLKEDINFYIEEFSLTNIRAKALIRDYKNDPAFTLTLDEERAIFIESFLTMLIALFCLVFAGTFCTWFLYRRVQQVILEPLANLTASMDRLGSNPALPLISGTNPNDEISLLYQKYYEVTEKLLKAQEALEKRSSLLEVETLTDPLTKLYNRRYLERLIPVMNENLKVQPDEQKLLLVIDIDYFKAMNDKFGHSTGDAVLIQLAQLLKSIFHEQDHIVRMGGEEFLIIASCRGTQQNQALTEQVRQRVEKFAFTTSQNQSLHVTVSIGFSWYPLGHSSISVRNWQAALQLADYALYQAKSGGRNRWYGYYADPSINDDQLAMIPNQVEALTESRILHRLKSNNDQQT